METHSPLFNVLHGLVIFVNACSCVDDFEFYLGLFMEASLVGPFSWVGNRLGDRVITVFLLSLHQLECA